MLLAFTCLLVSDVDAAGDEKAVRFTAPKFDGKQSSWAVWFAMFKSFLTLTCVAAFQLLDRPPVLTTRDAVAASEGNPAIPAVTAEDIVAEDQANKTLWHLLIQSIDDQDTVRALLPHAGNGHAAFADLENRFVGAASDCLLGLVLDIVLGLDFHLGLFLRRVRYLAVGHLLFCIVIVLVFGEKMKTILGRIPRDFSQ